MSAQITTTDVRNGNGLADANGIEYLVMTEKKNEYDPRVYRRDASGKLTEVFNFPGEKGSAVWIEQVKSQLIAYAGIRQDGGACLVFRYEVPSVVLAQYPTPSGSPALTTAELQRRLLAAETALAELQRGGTSTVDITARNTATAAQNAAQKAANRAEYAVTKFTELANLVAGLPTLADFEGVAWAKANDAIAAKVTEWRTYADPNLFNLMWDRGVRLLESAKLVAVGSIKVNSQKDKDA